LSEDISVALENVFKDTSNFIVIGLTGRTGSGCSTAADILTKPTLNLPEAGSSHFFGNEARKFKIIKKYIDAHWEPFDWLQIRSVITRYILELNFAEFCTLVSAVLEMELIEIRPKLVGLKIEYDLAHTRINNFLDLEEKTVGGQNNKKTEAYEIFFKWLPAFSNTLRDHLQKVSVSAYTKIYQTVGDNLRASGVANVSKFSPDKIFRFAETINRAIKSARFVKRQANLPCYVVVDAIRNPYEAFYLKKRHSDFHLMSVNTSNTNRLTHLRKSHKFSDSQIHDLDNKEYPSKLEGYKKYTSQNIQKCIEISDIHINNPKSDEYGHSELRSQLAWYVSLMMHPGLVMPTSIESCMQLAYSVKQNSGCISRQVGAVVTDASFAVKTVGWNNTAQGQVPCLLRSAEDLISGIDGNAYSVYERNDEKFREVLNQKFKGFVGSPKLKGRNLSYCFKDLQNEVEKEKNQVHTRSLHAEENAFLQIAKFGGQALKGGILFTTASPCELCAKKAYQLGISKIFYIDPYPGIATSHILSSGENAPDLILFRGAVGKAFHKLYQPLTPYKDELELLLSIPKGSNKKEIQIKQLTEEVISLREENERLKAQLKS
jgi:deoxycytidylate deaminase